MSLFKRYGDLIFAIALFIHCLFIYLGMSEARTISKLTLIPILIVFLASFDGRSSLLVYMGLIFSFLGDLLLSRNGEIFFLLGMLAFIGTHVCNGLFFIGLQKGKLGRGRATYFAMGLLVLFSAIVFSQIRSNLGSFVLPIIIYMCIICLMAVLATGTLQNPSIKKLATVFIIPGAGFFVLSDTILAINKFLFHHPLHDIIIMVTYGLAQYLLVKGFAGIKSTGQS